MPTIFDIVEHGTSQIILKAIAAGADPNTTEYSEICNGELNLYEFNLLLCANEDELRKINDHVKAGEILLVAGCHSSVVQRVIAEVNGKSSMSNAQKSAIDKLKTLPMTTVQSLAFVSRTALFKQMRIIKGPYVTCDLMQQLISTEKLPKAIEEFLRFKIMNKWK